MKLFTAPHQRTLGKLQSIEFQASAGSPTIICMHGYGADAADLTPIAMELDLSRPVRWIFPQAPLPLNIPFSQGRAWFPIDEAELMRVQVEGKKFDLSGDPPEGLEEAVSAMQESIAALEQPWEQIIIGGFSQGAMIALELALRAPTPPKGLFILSGTLVDEAALILRAPSKAGLRFFQSHATDDPLLDFEAAKRLNEKLNQSGLEGKLFSFSGGHGVPHVAIEGLQAYLNSVIGNAS